MRTTHARTQQQLIQLCAVAWACCSVVWAAPVDDNHLLQVEHRGGGGEDLGAGVLLTDTAPLGDPDVVMPEGGNFMWTGHDGSYRFGLQSEDQWRIESRNVDGVVEGRYVYKSPDGQTVDISYNAGPQGFIAEGDAIPGGRAPLVDDVPIHYKENQDIEGFIAEEEAITGIQAPLVDAPTYYDQNQDLQPSSPAVEDVESVPYGALRVSSLLNRLPNFPAVYRDDNTIEDQDAQAIIIPYIQIKPTTSAVDDVVPYGALLVSTLLNNLPGFQAVYRDDNTIEDLDAEAIIIPGLLPPTAAVWPPQLTFNPLPQAPLPRDDLTDHIYGPTDHIYGPPLLNGELLQSGVIEA